MMAKIYYVDERRTTRTQRQRVARQGAEMLPAKCYKLICEIGQGNPEFQKVSSDDEVMDQLVEQFCLGDRARLPVRKMRSGDVVVLDGNQEVGTGTSTRMYRIVYDGWKKVNGFREEVPETVDITQLTPVQRSVLGQLCADGEGVCTASVQTGNALKKLRLVTLTREGRQRRLTLTDRGIRSCKAAGMAVACEDQRAYLDRQSKLQGMERALRRSLEEMEGVHAKLKGVMEKVDEELQQSGQDANEAGPYYQMMHFLEWDTDTYLTTYAWVQLETPLRRAVERARQDVHLSLVYIQDIAEEVEACILGSLKNHQFRGRSTNPMANLKDECRGDAAGRVLDTLQAIFAELGTYRSYY